jgi:hypothetical protein
MGLDLLFDNWIHSVHKYVLRYEENPNPCFVIGLICLKKCEGMTQTSTMASAAL